MRATILVSAVLGALAAQSASALTTGQPTSYRHPFKVNHHLRATREAEEEGVQWFTNKVDHFNEKDDRTYQQRYWVNDSAFDKEKGPVFLYVCGEWTCSAPDVNDYPLQVGQERGALVISLEHRYYGDSQPFENWSTDNLKFLSSEQALADAAAFIDGINEQLGRKADWIVTGGSYPGALVAWFKSQYPEHAVGAWSSSGVINAVYDFTAFDLDIWTKTDASGPDCSSQVQRAVELVTEMFKTKEGTEKVCDAFGIKPDALNKKDFWFFFADIFVMGVQYGSRLTMCGTLAKQESDDQLLAAVVDLASGYGINYDQYDAVSLGKTTIDVNSNLRQWTYQYCTEFGFFQTPNKEHPARSQELEIDFWPDYCNRVFGTKIETKTKETNKLYGGLDIQGDNILFFNGSEDPWQFAAMRTLRHPDTTQSTMKAHYIDCDTCAHCVDFHAPADDQSESLTEAQVIGAAEVDRWLAEAAEKRAAAANAEREQVNWQDVDFERKRLDASEMVFEGDGTVNFLN